jgi:hypothetical protein
VANVKINVDVDSQGAMKGFDLVVAGLEKTNQKAKQTQEGMAGMSRTLKGEVTDAVTGLQGSLGSLGAVMGSAGPAGIAVAAATAAYIGFAKSMWDGMNAAAAYGGAIDDASKRTGRSREFIQQYGKAWEIAGGTMEGVANAANYLDLNLGKAPQKFEAMGLSVEELLSMNPDQRFKAVADQIGGMTDQTEQSVAAQAAFGKGWKEALQAIRDGALDAAGGMATLSDDQIEALDRVGDAEKRVEQAWATLKAGVFADIAQGSNLPEVIENTAAALNKLASVIKGNKSAFDEMPVIGGLIQAVRGASQWIDLLAPASMPTPKTKTGLDSSRTIDHTRDALFDARTQQQLDKDLAAQQKQAAADKRAADQAEARLKSEQQRQEKAMRGAMHTPHDVLSPEELLGFGQIPQEVMDLIYKSQLDALKSGRELPNGGIDDYRARTYAGRGGLWYDAALSPDVAESYKKVEDQTKKNQSATVDWSKSLQDVANLMLVLGKEGGSMGKIASYASSIVGGLAMGQQWKNSSGSIAGNIGSLAAVGAASYTTASWEQGAIQGGIAGAETGQWELALAGAAVGGFMGYMGQKDQEKQALKNIDTELVKQYGSWKKASQAAAQYGINLEELKKKGLGALGRGISDLAKEEEAAARRISGAEGLMTSVPALFESGVDWAGLGEAGATIFNNSFWAVAKEKGLDQASAAFGPVWAKLKAELQASGVDLSAFGGTERAIALGGNKQYATAANVARIGASVVQGWQDTGMTDAGSMSAMSKLAKQQYDAALGAGATGQEAMLAVGPLIKQQIAAYRDSGQAMDKDLQALIEEAKANGVKFLQTPMEQSVDLLRQIAENTGGLGNVSGEGGSASAEPGMASGGITRTGPNGRSYTLHNREAVIPLDRLPQVVGSFGGNTGAPPVQVTMDVGGVTLAVDPMASQETRDDLLRIVEGRMAEVLRKQQGELTYLIDRAIERRAKA